MSKQDILAKFGEPDRISIIGGLHPVIFVFDDTRKLVDIVKDDWRPLSKKEVTISMDFEAYPQASSEDRQRMLKDLARKSEKGDLPVELKTAEDVERHFPDVFILESWNYNSTFSRIGANVHFDRTGVCDEVDEDFF